jgi:PKD repeat protein
MVIPDGGFNQNVCDPGESWPGECVVIPVQGSVYFIEETMGTVSTNASKRAVRVFSDLNTLTFRDVVVEYAEVNNVEINGNIDSLTIDDSILHYAGVNGLMCPGDIGSGSILNSNFDYNGRLDVWASGMHLFGLTSNLDIIGCSMSHNTDSGFNGRQLSNIYFEDCTANYNTHSGGGYGIAISEKATSSSDITMIDITAEDNGRDGIMIWAWYDYCSISDVTITGGLFTNNGWAGIRVLNWPASGSTGGIIDTVVISEADVLNNPFAGIWFEIGYGSADATTSYVNYNNIVGNGDYGILNSGDGVLDATCNWWGDLSGPNGVGPGIGDNVSDYVMYCPWLTDVYPAGDCTGGAICWNQNTGEYFCSIQSAIDDPDTNDNIGDHDTIEVFAVTDVEQVNVYKSVNIYGQGTDNTIIQSPDTLTDYFTTSNDNYPIVYINNVDDVVIHNLTVDGAGKGNSNYRFIGIAMYQAGATLKDLEVLNVQDTPFSGMQHGTGIYAWADGTGISHDVIVQDCLVEDFQKNGITLSGSDLNVEVTGCTVQGKGPTDVTAQNGIQVSHGASGSITENMVSGCSYIGDVWAASGILPYFADGVLEISDNVISENQANIYLGACSADITDNTITATAAGTQQDYFYGIIGDPGDPPIIPDASPFDDGTPPVDRTMYEITCTGNDVIGDGSSSSTGIGVYAGMYGTYDIEFTATNNNVKDWGFGFELYAYGSNDLIFADINYNNIVGNDYGVYNYLDTMTYDATCNWWGDFTGPTHSSNPYGSGDPVSDYVEYLPWLNLPFEDPNSVCGAGVCQDEVWVDDDFTTSTPGWYVDHFPSIQIALDRLNPDGTAWIFDGIYNEDLFIDADNCGNAGITIKGAYECFPTDETAIIQGSMLISVDDVTVKYLEFTPNTDAAVTVEDDVMDTMFECNKFRKDCVADAVGIVAEGTSLVTAELNWWGRMDGPDGGLMDDGIASGFGVFVLGDVMVEPWIGIHAEIAEPTGTIEVESGSAVSFDATGSFAYSFGSCCEETSLHKQYEWDFQDGSYSHNKMTTHVFDSPGTYEVSLMVDAPGIPGLYSNFMYDWAYVTVHVVEPDTPLTVNADGEGLGGYETRVGEPVQLFGDAFGGEGVYYWSWSFGDGTGSSEQNPVHVFDSAGTFTVELTVTSGDEMVSDTAEVLVYDIDELLVDLADGSGVAGEELLFAASVSGGVAPYEFEWRFGDGTMSTKQTPMHMYSSAGEYTVTVTVIDSEGREKSAMSAMVVDEQIEVEPVEITNVSGGLFLTANVASGSNPVDWSISVDGSVFVGGSGSGQLPAQVTEQVKLPFTFGFGRVDIMFSANDITKDYTAFLFGPFFLNLQEM